MALITISGYPCAGKSHRATQIKDHLEQRLADPTYTGPSLTVTVLSDDTLNVPRSAYDGESSSPLFASSVANKATNYDDVAPLERIKTADRKSQHAGRCSPLSSDT